MPIGKIQFKNSNGVVKTLSLDNNEDLIITNEDNSIQKNLLDKDNLSNADINTLNNILNPTKGGTGINTYQQGDILYSDNFNSLGKLKLVQYKCLPLFFAEINGS